MRIQLVVLNVQRDIGEWPQMWEPLIIVHWWVHVKPQTLLREYLNYFHRLIYWRSLWLPYFHAINVKYFKKFQLFDWTQLHRRNMKPIQIRILFHWIVKIFQLLLWISIQISHFQQIVHLEFSQQIKIVFIVLPVLRVINQLFMQIVLV